MQRALTIASIVAMLFPEPVSSKLGLVGIAAAAIWYAAEALL